MLFELHDSEYFAQLLFKAADLDNVNAISYKANPW